MTDHSEAFNELMQLLRLEPLEVNLFRGESRDIGTPRVFGGQVLSQAVLAAGATIEDRIIHSLHAYFLRGGDPHAPIVYSVDRSRDGRSFSARRVVAIQHGRPIFTLSASFQSPEAGLEHQVPGPSVPQPEDLHELQELPAAALERLPQKLRRWIGRLGPFEFRQVGEHDPLDPSPKPPAQQFWFKLHGTVPDDELLRHALLAYVSDFHLVGTATLPHGISWAQENLMMASLDHAMWYHRPFDFSDWLLYACDSPSSSGGRGLSRGEIFDRRGRLVASTAQEGVIRVRRDDQG